MIIAMLLAHLVGDYILQWDSLSRWKSRSLKGVLVHGSIVLIVTWLFALPFDSSWWPWVLFIGLTHTLIDALGLPVRKWLARAGVGLGAMILLVVDQTLHLTVIGLALVGSGYLTMPSMAADILVALSSHRILAFVLGYAFLTMPAWIFIEFTVYGLIRGTAPDFSVAVKNKYVSILERGLIATFVLLGQFILIPLVALPRLALEWPEIAGWTAVGGQKGETQVATDSQHGTLYIAQLLASITLAMIIGLGLRQL
jgi:hypothetical protein